MDQAPAGAARALPGPTIDVNVGYNLLSGTTVRQVLTRTRCVSAVAGPTEFTLMGDQRLFTSKFDVDTTGPCKGVPALAGYVISRVVNGNEDVPMTFATVSQGPDDMKFGPL